MRTTLALLLVAAFAAGCLSPTATTDGDDRPTRARLPAEFTRSFQGGEGRVEDAIAVDEGKQVRLTADNYAARTASSLRLTLVDPNGREHGECQLGTAAPPMGTPTADGGSCSIGSGAGWPHGTWLVRWDPTGSFDVRVRVEQL